MTRAEFMVARAQIGLAFMYGIGFIAVLIILIFKSGDITEFVKSMLLTMLGYLGALIQQQSSYFFARTRNNSPPDPTGDPNATTSKTESVSTVTSTSVGLPKPTATPDAG